MLNQYLSNRQFKRFHFTFGVSWSREDVVRAVVDMEYVTSNELGRFTMGFVLDVYFTYVVGSVQRTRDDVPDSWTRVMCGDGLAGSNLSDSCG